MLNYRKLDWVGDNIVSRLKSYTEVFGGFQIKFEIKPDYTGRLCLVDNTLNNENYIEVADVVEAKSKAQNLFENYTKSIIVNLLNVQQ